MTPAEAMAIVEGRDFSAEVNIASNLKTFLRVMTNHPAITYLLDWLAHREDAADLSERTRRLLEQDTEDGEETPADSAIAAYLWLLSSKDNELAQLTAEAILASDRCWWAKKVAETIVTQSDSHSEAAVCAGNGRNAAAARSENVTN